MGVLAWGAPPWLMLPAFGASAVLLAALPDAPVCRPRAVALGMAVSAMSAWAVQASTQALGVPAWMEAALAVALALGLMLLAGGEVDGVRVLSEESVQSMRTDRLTPEQKSQNFLGAPFWIGRGFGLNLSLVTDEAKATPFFGPGGPGTFSWPGAFGTWWQADPNANLILIYLIQNQPELSVDAAAAVAGNASQAKLRSARPKFVKRTYQALGL